ncbi:LCP family protein [Erysipelothrix anatis]|uniref:LCP family protein n=1 Tax=Erysipelothrix anatis TaxID=2683713 RepID=UPI00135B87DD|nr:LCP family protein [Erysipelothrix anatis]
MKNKEFILSRKWFILLVQFVATAVTVYFIYTIGLLPMKFFIPITASLLVLFLFMSILVYKTKGKLQVFSKILSLVLSLSLVLGSRYLMKGGNFVNLITGANKDTHVISVVVEKDSPYNSLTELAGKKIGANTQMDSKNIEKSKALFLEKNLNLDSLENYTMYDSLQKDLISNDLDAILLSESHRSLVEEINKDFTSQTRVVGYVTYEVESTVQKANVDVLNETFSIYLTGIDTYGPVSSVSRSDVNMIMTVNPNTNQILLTGVPRDYHVELGTIGAMDKLTHAGIYGVGESVATLEKLLDIQIDYYLKVNFSSVEKIVDAMGGVEVYSNQSFKTTTKPFPYINQGQNTLDGAEALSFVRERYNLSDGDNGRVRNQQELVKGLLNRALSPSILINFDSILASVGDSMQMSMSDKEFKALIRNQLDTGNSWEVLQYQLEGYGGTSNSTYSMPGWDLYVMNPNYDTVNKASGMIDSMEKNERISMQ